MYVFYLLFEWLGSHPFWTGLGVFVVVGTVIISLYFDKGTSR